MSKDIAIKVEGVSKTFKLPHEKTTSIKSAVVNFYKHKRSFEKQQALKNVSFEIEKGEFFGIVGRNGSGKSTMLKMLAGIYIPTEGTIQINGKLTPFIELGVGFNPELTGRENVFLNGALLGFNRKEIGEMYESIVEFAELHRFMDQKLKNYSSGMQVRLAFSIAIRAQSDILLLDEVLAVGDAAFQKKCFDYFYELKSKKATVCFVSHDMASVERFCDRALYLENGQIVDINKPGFISEIYKKKNEQNEQDHRELEKEQVKGELDNKDIFMQASTIGSTGKRVKNIDSSEDIIIDVEITAKKQIKNAMVSFTIENDNANTIIGTNTHSLNAQMIDLEKGQKENLQFIVENILGEGNYVVDMEVSTENRSYVYGHQDEILKFKVVDYGQFPWLLRPRILVKSKKLGS